MTEKRFIFVGSGIEDNVDNESYLYIKDGFQDVCDSLNELANENEQLKKEIAKTEKIKQQRDFYYARLQRIIKIANGDFE